METAHSSHTYAHIYQSTWCHIPEDSTYKNHIIIQEKKKRLRSGVRAPVTQNCNFCLMLMFTLVILFFFIFIFILDFLLFTICSFHLLLETFVNTCFSALSFLLFCVHFCFLPIFTECNSAVE